MKNSRKITDGIREIGGAGIYEIYSGKVISVDKDTLTIDVELDTGVIRFDVRLRAVIDDNSGVYVMPTINSYCTIAQIEGGQDYVLLRASKIDKYVLKIENTSLEVSSDGFIFNSGSLKGMVKITELVQQLNAIESKVNEIVAWTGAHLHSGSGAGTAPAVPGTLTPTTIPDLENEKIKQ